MGLPGCRKSAHVRTTYIDTPVRMVFDHVKDPRNFVAADPVPVRLSRVVLTPTGIGSSWQTSWRVAGLPVHAAWRRRELVPDSRIVDHASTGVTWTYATTPTNGGTTLSLGYEISTGIPLVDGVLDRLFRGQESQLDRMLASYKHAIEGASGP